uniref:Discs large protein n=1 Tax=Soboliphyme baturini TaxID=241478 RepID=A0A183J457_9BILA
LFSFISYVVLARSLKKAQAPVAVNGSADSAAFSDNNLSKDVCEYFDTNVVPPSQSTEVYSKFKEHGESTTALPSSHSEDSIFASTYLPSYIRVSCALSGYANYRRSPGQYGSVMDADHRHVSSTAKYPWSPPQGPGTLPLGRSLVERRLQKFESPSEATPPVLPTKPNDQQSPTSVTNDKRDTKSQEINTDVVLSPVPVRELICNFNRLTLNEDVSSVSCESQAIVVASPAVLLENGDMHVAEDLAKYDESNVGEGFITRDGAYFKKTAADERYRIEHLCAEYEGFLENNDGISEEVLEKVRLAVGKAKLLLSKKFRTFEELIERNLKPGSEDEQIPNEADLDGYWKLVSIEICDIDKCFNSLTNLKSSQWAASEGEEDTAGISPDTVAESISPPSTKKVTKKRAVTTKPGAKVSAKVAEEARQRLKEAKLSAMEKQRKLNLVAGDNSANDVQIFVS